jgi:undecaprenyl-diphosphatase
MAPLLIWVREAWLWLPLYVFVIATVAYNSGRKAWLIIFFFILTASTSDFTSASLLKPLFERERPCQDIEHFDQVNLRVNCGSGKSFPSSHATNHMAMAVFLFLLFKNVFRKGRYLFLIWAFIISFAQVYVGVHYPLDILGGWILGILIALLLFRILRFYIHYFFEQAKQAGLS